jgi:RNA polymerase sigma factor (sigma-70 family)
MVFESDLTYLNPSEVANMIDQFLLQYELDLRSYCRMLSGTPWDADDLYQETMLKALKAEVKLLQHPSPKALLFRIASNAWIDECRKRKVDVGLPDNYEAINVDFDDYSFNVKDSLELLVAIVPPLQVVVILLADVFEYSSHEIADMIGTTDGAVKAAMHRARKRLTAAAQDEALEGTFVKRKDTEERGALIRQFLEAFRLQEPIGIADAYRRLIHVGIRAERHLLSGKLHFTFRDEEGYAFTIMAE